MTPRLFGQTVPLQGLMQIDVAAYGTFTPQINEIALARLYYGKGFEYGIAEVREEIEKRIAARPLCS